ncbi:hypothetical protein HTG_04530 [Natrinema mahii]|nr:hypothetical protein HTG_04530 [Natrinema mahii]
MTMIDHQTIDPHLPRGWLISLTLQAYWQTDEPIYRYEDTRYFLEFIRDDSSFGDADYLIVLKTPDGEQSEFASEDEFIEVLSELARVPLDNQDGGGDDVR